jgi:CheY-like chemotaxis protein
MATGQVLVVEDDPSVASLVQAALEMEGYGVQTASNGQEALTQVERQPDLPSLVITDLRMPVMDGWEFLRTFRQRWGGEVPVVIMTATYAPASSDDARQAAAVLHKPFDLETLLDTVGSLVASRLQALRKVRLQPDANANAYMVQADARRAPGRQAVGRARGAADGQHSTPSG